MKEKREKMIYGLVAGFFVLLFYCSIVVAPVFAQADCYEDGTFGPTCPATAAPTGTSAPLPPTNTPPPELPKSGNMSMTLAIFGGGAAFLIFGLFQVLPHSIANLKK